MTPVQAAEVVVAHGYDPEIDGRDAGAVLAAAKDGPLDLLDAFLALGAHIDARENVDGPPIVAAAEAGSLERIELLIARGADLESTDVSGDTALQTAANWEHADLVRALAKRGAIVNRVNHKRFTPLTAAVVGKRDDVVETLLDLGANPDHGREQDVPPATLIAAGADVNELFEGGVESALALAVMREHHDVIDVLLAAGANPNVGSKLDKRPLMQAINNNDAATIAKLRRAGADTAHAIASLREWRTRPRITKLLAALEGPLAPAPTIKAKVAAGSKPRTKPKLKPQRDPTPKPKRKGTAPSKRKAKVPLSKAGAQTKPRPRPTPQ